MRLFVAIRLNDDVRDALAAVQAGLRAGRVGGNYTKRENLHLTLAFIGEYGDPDRVLDVMRSVPFRPFPIRLEGFGSFGDLYWCGLARQDELTVYVKRLRRALAEADIPFDRKRFSPHITLLRRASFDTLPGVAVPEASMTAERVSLMRSERGKNGMIYTELGAAPGRQGRNGMTQIERIAHYEDALDLLTAASAELDAALEAFAAAQPLARELDAYYGGGDWKEDFADDEAGRLPAGLKRGVLSEDAAYDALAENRRLLRRMLEIAAQGV